MQSLLQILTSVPSWQSSQTPRHSTDSAAYGLVNSAIMLQSPWLLGGSAIMVQSPPACDPVKWLPWLIVPLLPSQSYSTLWCKVPAAFSQLRMQKLADQSGTFYTKQIMHMPKTTENNKNKRKNVGSIPTLTKTPYTDTCIWQGFLNGSWLGHKILEK